MSFTNPSQTRQEAPGEVSAGTIKYHGALAIVTYDGPRNADSEMEGDGKCIYAGGAQYVGQFSKDMLNGWGTMTDALGNVYEGEWKDDMRHGRATFKHSAGCYVGEYFENKRHGKGKETDLLGNTFEGDYIGGKAVRGKICYENGDVYVGEVDDDEKHGIGKLIIADTGEVLNGRWDHDEFIA